MKITKAVIPAAGLGTRFLPVTKSMPKEMLPIIDTPAIHYVVKEAIDSGIDDIIIITGRGKKPLEDYFDESPELEMHLEKNKKDDLLETVREISSLADVHYIRQKEPRGLPDAIQTAEKHIGDDPFAVLLGDDIITSTVPCAKQLINVFEKHKSSVIAVQNVPREKISRYGSVETENTAEAQIHLIKNIVEKPKIEEAPSTIAAIGRYIFTPEIFDCIHKTKPGINNEMQIADSINILTKSQKVYACAFEGKRYDIGDKLGYIQAIIDFSLKNREIKTDIKNYIRKIN